MPEAERRVALITGAGNGIGRGIALALATEGWTIVINDLPGPDGAEHANAVATQVEALGATALVNLADIAIADERELLVNNTLHSLGRLDLLVNNAGVSPKVRINILDVAEESYDRVMNINLKSPFFLSQRVANAMIKLLQAEKIERPAIINIGSLNAYTSSPNRGEYCLSKAGVGMLTSLFADQLAPHGINVYEIRPGIINTNMTRVVKEKYDKLISEGITPLQRWGQPEDVARAVVAIAQDYLPFSTGEIINVDGGFHMRRL